jgi:hypothetical protein
VRITALDQRLRRYRIPTAPDTLLLTCLYVVSIALSHEPVGADFLWLLGLKLIFILPLVIATAALLRVLKRFRCRAQRVNHFRDCAVGKLLREAGVEGTRIERLRAYRIPNPRRCAVNITGFFKSQIVYTSGFELLCKYNPRSASNILFHEAAHLLRRDTLLLGMMIVAGCAVASNQLLLGTYSRWTRFWVPLAIAILFVFLFRRREYTADAIAINRLDSKAQYVVGLFVGDVYESGLWHPLPAARIAALYRGSPVLSISWLLLGLCSLFVLFYCTQPFAVVFAILPLVAMVYELQKGVRPKVPATQSEHLGMSLSIAPSVGTGTTMSDWRRMFAADCLTQVRRYADDGDTDKAAAFAKQADVLLNQLGSDSFPQTLSESLSPVLDSEVLGAASQTNESSSYPSDVANQLAIGSRRSRPFRCRQALRRLGRQYQSVLLIAPFGACVLVVFYVGALRIVTGPLPVKQWSNVPCKIVENRRTIPFERMISFRNDDLIIERQGDWLSLSLRSAVPSFLSKDPELLATSISGKYNALLRNQKELVLGYGHRHSVGKPETIIIKVNGSQEEVFRNEVNDPVIAVGFSRDDEFAAVATWNNSEYASNVSIVPLGGRGGREKSCEFNEQIVDAVRVQPGGKSFTVSGYSSEHFTVDAGMLSEERTAQLVSLQTCEVIRSVAVLIEGSQPFDWTPDGTTVAFFNRRVRVENLVTGYSMPFDAGGFIEAIGLSADGEYLFTVSSDIVTDQSFIKMWSTQRHSLRASAKIASYVYRLAVPPSGNRVWVLTAGGGWPAGCDAAVWNGVSWHDGGQFWNTQADTVVGKFLARQTGIERAAQ